MSASRVAAVVLSLGLAFVVGCAPRETFLPNPPALRDFPEDFTSPVSEETGLPMPGFGGGTGSALRHTPILFVHGNGESARYWLEARAAFRAEGWTDDELWAFGYGWDNPRWFDSNDASVPSIRRMVDAVTQYLSRKTGREVRQVDIVAHSLGVTAVRQWMLQDNAWHRVRAFVAVSGANHGVWTARSDARGQNRVSSFEIAPGSAWLAQLNRAGETPGPTRYLALYDGTGWYDVLFPSPLQDSPRLEGATNLALDRDRGFHLDHLEMGRAPAAVAAMAEFLRAAGEGIPQAVPPMLYRDGDRVHGGTADDLVHCTTGAVLPSRATPGVAEAAIAAGAVTTCFAFNARTGWASPMQRFVGAPSVAAGAAAPLELHADPEGGVFEQPVSVRLAASEPAVAIVYTTSGATPESGSPLYVEPVAIAGKVTLRAVAIASDGRRSNEVRVKVDVSLRAVEESHALRRQFE